MCLFARGAQARPPGQMAAGVVPGRLLVKFRSDVDDQGKKSVLDQEGGQDDGCLRHLPIKRVGLPAGSDEQTAADAFKKHQEVEFAEPDVLLAPDAVPNDPYYPNEWHLATIAAPAAWDTTPGSSSVIVAILDTGCDPAHPDLAPQYVAGWNAYDNNSSTADVYGHGTAVAGTAAAAGNNASGVTSIAWNCRIMPVRVTDTSGSASLSALASGLTWAADHGARVANISFMASDYSTVTTGAQYFEGKGGVVTIAAGNYSTFDSTADNTHVLTVSATGSNDLLASWSNTGNNIDLAAPGDYIYTTNNGGGYGQWSGTSFSAPVVAGVAALVISANPTLSSSQIQQVLKNSADDLGASGWDASYGWGRVNAARAVALALTTGTRDTTRPTVSLTSPSNGAAVSGTISVQATATDNVGVAWLSLYVDGALQSSLCTTPYVFSWNSSTVPNGTHTLQVTAKDPAGNTTSSSVQVNVTNVVASAPRLLAAVSRKVHGTAGAFDIPLPLTGSSGVEPRSGGVTQLVLTFDQTVQAIDGILNSEVSVSSGGVASISVNGSQIIANVASVGDGCMSVTITGLASTAGVPLGSPVVFSVRALQGDVNASGNITLSDGMAVKSHYGQLVTAQTALYDIDLSGTIDMNDAMLAKSEVTHSLSCSP